MSVHPAFSSGRVSSSNLPISPQIFHLSGRTEHTLHLTPTRACIALAQSFAFPAAGSIDLPPHQPGFRPPLAEGGSSVRPSRLWPQRARGDLSRCWPVVLCGQGSELGVLVTPHSWVFYLLRDVQQLRKTAAVPLPSALRLCVLRNTDRRGRQNRQKPWHHGSSRNTVPSCCDFKRDGTGVTEGRRRGRALARAGQPAHPARQSTPRPCRDTAT